MRLVFDTNVLISACWSPGGLEAALVQRALDRHLTLCVTRAVWAEYVEVAARKKFASRRACFEEMLAALERVVVDVEPGPPASAAVDPDDNVLLECAAGANADWLITGNLRHFPSAWQNTRIGNAREFVTAVPPPANPVWTSTDS